MKFEAFDKTEQARFAAEVKEKWGGADSPAESEAGRTGWARVQGLRQHGCAFAGSLRMVRAV